MPPPIRNVRTAPMPAWPNFRIQWSFGRYENKDNLSDAFITDMEAKYAGTILGRQELNAEILSDLPGALVAMRHIDGSRVTETPELIDIVVGMDPAGTGVGALACGFGCAGRTVAGGSPAASSSASRQKASPTAMRQPEIPLIILEKSAEPERDVVGAGRN